MLPIVLVSLLVSSALALPAVQVNQYSINEIAPPRDNGRLVSSYVTISTWENLLDGGDVPINAATLQQIINDVANQGDLSSQAAALAQTIALVGALAPGIPGNSCEEAALLNAYADGIRINNLSGVRGALLVYLARLANNIDLIVDLATNPNGVRYAIGPKGNCVGGGRNYQFEAAWNAILDRTSPYSVGLVNEEYCTAKRLYSAIDVRSNNAGAAVSAATLPPVVKVIEQAIVQVAEFLRAVARGGNLRKAAAVAKKAILSARVPL